jgi:hypothetical protein
MYPTINGETLHFDILNDIGNFWLISIFEINQERVTCDALRQRLRHIVSRIPAMRFHFQYDGERWFKRISDTPEADVFIFKSQADDMDATLREMLLGVGIDDFPLSRFVLVENSSGRYLISAFNHMMMDAISTAHTRKQIVSDAVLDTSELAAEVVDENADYVAYYETVQSIAQQVTEDDLGYWFKHGMATQSILGQKRLSGQFGSGTPISQFDTQTLRISDTYVARVMSRFSSSFDGSLVSAMIAKILASLATQYGASCLPFWLVDGGRPRDQRFSRDHSQTCGELAFPIPVYPFINPAKSLQDLHDDVHSHVTHARDMAIDFASKYWNEADTSVLKSQLRKIDQPILQINYRGSVFERPKTGWAREIKNEIVFDQASQRIYDICFNIHRFGSHLECEVLYNTDRFETSEIAKIVALLESDSNVVDGHRAPDPNENIDKKLLEKKS